MSTTRLSRQIFIVIALTGLMAAFVCWLFSERQVPVYEGKTLDVWLETMSDANPDHRDTAARVLGRVVKDKGEEIGNRILAVYALARAGPSDPAAMHDLCLAINDEELAIREAVAKALGLSCCNSQEVVDALTVAVADPEVRVRRAAIKSLEMVGTRAVAPAARSALADGDEYVRQIAADLLNRISEDSGESVR